MILYLNNFKGFSDTFIPLEKVNFLVGENSTGKSTVLSILEIIAKNSFWMSPQLSSPEYKLGPFREIVNQFSTDKSFFEIGLEFRTFNAFESAAKRVTMRVLETFKERDGNIVLDSIKYVIEGHTVFCCNINEKKIQVSKSKAQYPSFAKWIHSQKPLRYKEISNYADTSLIWLPSLMKFAQEALNIKDDTYRMFYPLELSNLTVMSPIRAEAHRIYETFTQSYSPQGDHIPAVLNSLMHSKNKENKTIINRINEFGKNSHLFDSISTHEFGSASNSPFMLAIGYDRVTVNITEVGYGVIQSLPFIVEFFKSKSSVFSIQQPEVHLHPKAQAAFGDLIYESAVMDNNGFFCETHSDYIINRFRYAMNKGTSAVNAQVLFFSRDEDGTHVKQIPIGKDGHYKVVPEEYMRFFIDEELRMLEF